MSEQVGNVEGLYAARAFRDLGEDDVARALQDSYVADKLGACEPAALLEFYNRMLDIAVGQGVGEDE